MPILIVLALAAVLALVFLIAIYNGLVSARARVQESWSGVDTELQRRHDLIPNLVESVKGYMKHEREMLTALVELREQADRLRPGAATTEQARIEGQLGAALGGLKLRFEAYPELKASANFVALQGELANTEDRVQGALRFYNGNVRDLNVKCDSFPSSMFASMFSFEKAQFFELKDQAARVAPKVSF